MTDLLHYPKLAHTTEKMDVQYVAKTYYWVCLGNKVDTEFKQFRTWAKGAAPT